MNLVAATFNILVYLIPLKIKGSLIILFYVFSFLEAITYVIAMIARLIDPDEIFYDYSTPPQIDVAQISKDLANFFSLVVGFIVLLTMF